MLLRIIQSVFSLAALGAAWYLSSLSAEDVDHMFARSNPSDPASLIMAHTLMKHDHSGLLVWGIALILCGVIWTVPALAHQPSRR